MLYNPINIIIADDHEIFLNGLKQLISELPELHLLGQASNGRQLIEMVNKTTPDIIITDIKMPLMDGIEATRCIKKQHPDIGVIALSMFNDDELVIDMLEAGASGYLLKNTNKMELLNAVKAIKNNSHYYCSATSEKLLCMIAESRYNPYKKRIRPNFSNRELQVIHFICKEYTNKEMASAMNLSIRTIESHKEKIQEKMGAKNSTGIAVYAVKNKLFKEV